MATLFCIRLIRMLIGQWETAVRVFWQLNISFFFFFISEQEVDLLVVLRPEWIGSGSAVSICVLLSGQRRTRKHRSDDRKRRNNKKYKKNLTWMTSCSKSKYKKKKPTWKKLIIWSCFSEDELDKIKKSVNKQDQIYFSKIPFTSPRSEHILFHFRVKQKELFLSCG